MLSQRVADMSQEELERMRPVQAYSVDAVQNVLARARAMAATAPTY